MRKASIFLLVLLALAVARPAKARVSLGAIGGLNIANLKGEAQDGTEFDFSSRKVVGIGGVADIALKENFFLRFEPMFLQWGAELEDELNGFEGQGTYSGSYFAVPVLFRIALGTSDTQPYLMAGPSLGFKLSSKAEFDAEGEIREFVGFDDLIKGTNYSLVFGGGVSHRLESLSLFAEGKYSLGVTDIFKPGAVEVAGYGELEINEAEITTKGFQFMGGITFPVGGNEH